MIIIYFTALLPIALAQRPVYPLIIAARAPNAGNRANEATSDRPPPPIVQKAIIDEVKQVNFALAPNSQFVRASGSRKPCKQHSDCYSQREPDEWCLNPALDTTYDKGCFCESNRGLCTIERSGPSGSEHTDCTEKATSRCLSGGSASPDIQFSSDASKSTVGSNSVEKNGIIPADGRSNEIDSGKRIFVLSPKSVYVQTSARSKSCKLHDDCYDSREPDEWCPMPPEDKYGDKGCFCEPYTRRCLIERQIATGGEYSDCAPKSSSKCQWPTTNGREKSSDIQKASAAASASAPAEDKRLVASQWAAAMGLFTVAPRAAYVATSGRPKACMYHQDCYHLREPNEWCPLPLSDRYFEKGCFCDYVRRACTIEREIASGSEFTDCSDKSTSTCLLSS